MATTQDWCDVNGLKPEQLSVAIRSMSLLSLRQNSPNRNYTILFPAWQSALSDIIVPAFEVFAFADDILPGLLGDVEFNMNSELRPVTIGASEQDPPRIFMNWRGDAEDLLVLAHETAHAVQNLLTKPNDPPGVVREICAFLGELAVIEHTRTLKPDLHAALLEVWQRHNTRYLGSDVTSLVTAIDDLSTPYSYRLNYPLARYLAAFEWHRSQASALAAWFDGGKSLEQPLADLVEARETLPTQNAADAWSDMESKLFATFPKQTELLRNASNEMVTTFDDMIAPAYYGLTDRGPRLGQLLRYAEHVKPCDLADLAGHFAASIARVDEDAQHIPRALTESIVQADLEADHHFARDALSDYWQSRLACPATVTAQALVARAASDMSMSELWPLLGHPDASAFLKSESGCGVCENGDVTPLSEAELKLDARAYRALGMRALEQISSEDKDSPSIIDFFTQSFEKNRAQAEDNDWDETLCNALPEFDRIAGLGVAIEMMAGAEHHKPFKLRHYLNIEILPPLRRGQFRLYFDTLGKPVGFVTWAWLSQEVEAKMHTTNLALREAEWDCGDRLFSNDWITDSKYFRSIYLEMSERLFPDAAASSVRRDSSGTVRKVCRWTGRNLRKAKPVMEKTENTTAKCSGRCAKSTCVHAAQSSQGQAHAVPVRHA